MNRLTLVATIGAVLLAAILGLIYAVSKQDVDDTPETAQSGTAQPGTEPAPPAQPANPPAAEPSTPAADQPAASAQPATNPAPAEPPAAQSTITGATEPKPIEPAENQATNAPATSPQPAPAPAQPATDNQVAAVTPPPAPEIKPSFDVVRVNPNGDAVIAGRAAPGTKITLLDNGQPVGSAEADDRGEWVLLPDSAVDPGQHNFSVRATDESGKAQDSEKKVLVIVPKPAEDIAGQPVTRPSGALALEVPKSGEAPTQLLNSPGAATTPQPATASTAEGSAPPPPLSLDTIDYTQDGRAMLSGHTLPDSNLIIYLDNGSIGTSKADGSGRWTFVPEQKAPTGDHQLRVDLVDGAGKVQARVQVPFSQPDFSTVVLKDDSVIVQPGNSLWRIARRTYGDGVLYTVIFEANKDRIGNPDLIYPGQIFELPTKKQN